MARDAPSIRSVVARVRRRPDGRVESPELPDDVPEKAALAKSVSLELGRGGCSQLVKLAAPVESRTSEMFCMPPV